MNDKRSDRAYVRGLRARTPFGRAIARILETFWLALERRRTSAQLDRIDRYLDAVAMARNDYDLIAAAERYAAER